MATQAFVSPAQYLAMSFDGLDREYVDGELKERGMPTYLHAKIQGLLCFLLGALRKPYGLVVLPELRLALDAARLYRIPDVCVFAAGDVAESVPSHPPLVAIEIVSPDDRTSETLRKFREYHEWGVAHIWLVDPVEKRLFVFDGDGLHPVDSFSLPQFSFTITLSDLELA